MPSSGDYAAAETGLRIDAFPKFPPVTPAAALDPDFLPD
jgi:hypothetical protein